MNSSVTELKPENLKAIEKHCSAGPGTLGLMESIMGKIIVPSDIKGLFDTSSEDLGFKTFFVFTKIIDPKHKVDIVRF